VEDRVNVMSAKRRPFFEVPNATALASEPALGTNSACLSLTSHGEFQRRSKMKALILSAAVATTAMLGAVSGSSAQQSGAFCLRSDEGNLNCAYESMAQCEAAKKGVSNTGTCVRNPSSSSGGGN
jgi:Protein of unknown function (DUF3551)